MNQIQELESLIEHLDTCYELGLDCKHPTTGVIVTDGEYDALRRQLKIFAPNSKIFATATASKNDAVQKIKHDPPMTSIEKASHEDFKIKKSMLFKWIADCTIPDVVRKMQTTNYILENEKYNGNDVVYADNYFYQMYKLDGVALALYYEKGKLVKAGLRPRDGVNGEDVTEQVKHVEGIPEKLKKPITCSIRGELICKLSDFEKVQKELADAGEQLRANPRNHAAGGIRQFKDPSKVKNMRLSFIAYGIEGYDDPPYETEIERAIWCNKELGIKFVQARAFNFNSLQDMEDMAPSLDYEVDGVIIGVNNLDVQEQLGRHGDKKTGNPKGKIAWKFAEEEATPVINEITWQTGRTGKIVPVANFDVVRLAGTNVTKATLHNYGFMSRNRIDVGTTITVLKAGKIIPKVVGVVKNKCHGDPTYPSKCPACNSKTELVAGGTDSDGNVMWELMCLNDTCDAKILNNLCHYLTVFGVLGLGENRVAALVDGGIVSTYSDFYKITLNEVMACGLSERQATLALAAIHMVPQPEKISDNEKLKLKLKAAIKSKKKIPLWQLIASFGMDGAGKSTGKVLVDHFGDFDAIRNAALEELQAVDEIGEKTAIVVKEYFDNNSDEIDELLKFVEPELPKKGKLTGKVFVLSGSFEEGKKYWENKIEDLGGKTSGSVGRKTSYLVAGPGSGSKSDKAQELGVPIISVEDLEKML